jgi:type I restriction enzyme S subunit
MKSGGEILGTDLNMSTETNNGVFLSYYLNSARRKLDIAIFHKRYLSLSFIFKSISLLNVSLPIVERTAKKKIANFLSAGSMEK